jgi:menaquinone-specific isochorismate synthase
MIHCETRPLQGDVDLNHVAGSDGILFVRDGIGLAAQGVVARVGVDDVMEVLASIDTVDHVGEPGCGPVAIGAIPFRPGDPAELVIPELVVGKGPDGHRWVTRVRHVSTAPTGSAFDDQMFVVRQHPVPPPVAGSFEVAPGADVNGYLDAVRSARAAVRSGAIAKVVIAREVVVRSREPFDVHAVLLRLRASFGSSYRYSIDGFIGASPELLVSRHGDVVRSHPLAGTTARTGDPTTDARLAAQLIASMKDQLEHRVVIDEVHDSLLPWCSYLDWEPEPSIVTVANVQHLGTLIEGRLSHPCPSVLELATTLSPTPALGGFPRRAALEAIERLENLDRGRYGGTVGWVDRHGQGTWAVSIRCALLSDDRRTAHLFAGGGIVGDSDPLAELSETQAKLQAMLSALVRP